MSALDSVATEEEVTHRGVALHVVDDRDLCDRTDLPVINTTALVVKRLIDVVGASMGLLVTLPFWVLIAVLVKASGPGPVFFRQQRVGKGGVPFEVVKFRTMRDGTHQEVLGCEEQRAAYAANDFKLSPDDPRITKVGKVLRKTSLDELPQLINVVRGEMSLVGIRPLLADEVALRTKYDQACYQLLAPGMTGLWQVEGRSTVRAQDRVALDRQYVEAWSLGADMKLLVLTPLAVLHLRRAV